MLAVLAALYMVQLAGPDGQAIELNPSKVVSIRSVRGTDHVSKTVRCLIFTADAKYIGVIQTCVEVQRLLEEAR